MYSFINIPSCTAVCKRRIVNFVHCFLYPLKVPKCSVIEMKVFRLGPNRTTFIYFWTILFAVVVIHTEVLSYYFSTFSWLELECKNENDCSRLLLVADPQIIGLYNDMTLITPLSIFDSDRYLKKTYSYALDFTKPDLVVFLGDLMDEGEYATDAEFNLYARRLFNIFLSDRPNNIRHIWLPGDNDIGGEGHSVEAKLLKRFERAFSQPDLITYKNQTFFKINRMTESLPIYKERREFYQMDNIFIGLSHIPLMFMPSPFVEKVIKKMLPHLIFSAHEHKSMIISTDALLRSDRHIVPITPNNNQVFEYTLGVTDMYEIMVPTCSYRMGTPRIGYGSAILEKNEIRFTVLWTPDRLGQLWSYFLICAIFFLFIWMYWCCGCFCRRRCRL